MTAERLAWGFVAAVVVWRVALGLFRLLRRRYRAARRPSPWSPGKAQDQGRPGRLRPTPDESVKRGGRKERRP